MRIDLVDLPVTDPNNHVRIVSTFCKAASAAALVAVVLMSAVNSMLMDTGLGNVVEALIGATFGFAAVVVAIGLISAVVLLLRRVPTGAMLAFSGALLALYFLRANSPAMLLRSIADPGSWELPQLPPDSLSVAALAAIVAAMACASGLVAILRAGALNHPAKSIRLWLPALSILVVITGTAVIVDLARDGADPYPASYRPTADVAVVASTDDPSRPGSYATEFLTYGAGESLRRASFSTDRDLDSRTVDATKLLPEWKGLKQRMRERYWGFGLTEAPLNGLLWAPLGAGPFPLVLIVHGNHGMEDYSDAGYAYLGELLASRGFLTVSVDENFINGSWSGDFAGREMPMRAWLLLEHLALWRDWNDDSEHRFFGKVDLDNIALVGHSRGGEAVSIAHAYNRLTHYPDDATVSFDYGFNIRSLVAIAQVDQRYHRRVELENVNFFTIHGSYDSDEPAYHGLRQFNRIDLNDGNYWIKAGVYIHGANHGQFNSGWGRTDYSPPGSWLLNLAPIIPADDQQQIAKTYISAFLEATLHDEHRYLDFLKDPRAGAAWLPEQAYVQQFTDSTFRALADFEEDLNVSTASNSGTIITTDRLGLWREEELEHRDQRKQGTNVVVLGWNTDSAGDAVYSIRLSANSDTSLFTPDRALSFSVSSTTEQPPEIENGEDEEKNAKSGDDDLQSPAFRVELVDAFGQIASVLSSHHANLAPPMKVRFMKNPGLDKQSYNDAWEPVLQHMEIPLTALSASNPAFDLASTREIRLRFNQQPEGVIIFDDIGVTGPGP